MNGFITETMIRGYATDAIVSSVALLVADLLTGKIHYANTCLEELFGYTVRGELKGQSVDVLVPEALREGHALLREGYATNPRHRAMSGGLVLQGRTRQGGTIPVLVSLTPFMVDNSRCVAAIVSDMRPLPLPAPGA